MCGGSVLGLSCWVKDQAGIRSTAFQDNLVWFYGISTILGYLMPNPFLYIYIKYI